MQINTDSLLEGRGGGGQERGEGGGGCCFGLFSQNEQDATEPVVRLVAAGWKAICTCLCPHVSLGKSSCQRRQCVGVGKEGEKRECVCVCARTRARARVCGGGGCVYVCVCARAPPPVCTCTRSASLHARGTTHRLNMHRIRL